MPVQPSRQEQHCESHKGRGMTEKPGNPRATQTLVPGGKAKPGYFAGTASGSFRCN